jgi:branched-chain amino acid transport system permease protein
MAILLNALVNGILYGGVLALLAFGLNLIFGVLNVIHLAYGQCVMVGLYIIYVLTVLLHVPLLVSCLISIVTSGLLGILIHRLAVYPLLKAPLLNQLIALVGVMIVFENLAMGVFGTDYLGVQLIFPPFALGGIYIKISMLIAFGCSIVTLAILWLFLNKTYTGLAIKAVVQDKEAANLMAINTKQIYIITFAIGGILAGIVSSCFVPIYVVHPHFGSTFTLTAFVIVVLGGCGNLIGGFIAAFIIGIISQVGGMYLTTEIAELLVYVILVFVILFRPQGLLGVRVRA